MRRPASRRRWSALAVAGVLAVAACSGDDGEDGGGGPSSSSTAGAVTTTTVDPELAPFLIEAADLPGTFTPGGNVDDTITSFCANEDAASGLRATSRAVASFASDPAGFGVVQLVFRFRDDGAAAFVRQAGEALQRCSEVPDLRGLAFRYEAASPEVEAALAGTDQHVARYGTSVGSARLTEDIGVFRRGDVGVLVAILGVESDRPALDAVAVAAFAAAAAPG